MPEDDDLETFNIEEHRDEIQLLADDLELHVFSFIRAPGTEVHLKITDDNYFQWAAKLYEQGWRQTKVKP